jgi:hypothetical protein
MSDLDEAAFYLLPSVGWTWARKGQTPVLREGDRHPHVSAIRLVTETGALCYQRQTSLTVIGDNAPIHWGAAVNPFLQTANHGAIQLARLPAYSPELHANEQVWASIKEHE